MLIQSKTEGREVDFSDELDRFLSRKNLKKYEPKPEYKDTR